MLLMQLLLYYLLRQADGEKIMRSGNNSSRPANISNISTIFEGILKPLKFPAGPTTESPGPVLLIQAFTAEKSVTRSKESSVKIKTDKR